MHDYYSLDIPICDWATITCNCDSSKPQQVIELFKAITSVEPMKNGSGVYKIPETEGTIKLMYNKIYQTISLSGKALILLRKNPSFIPLFKKIFSDGMYNITRFDATMDIARPFHSVKQEVIRKYPDYRCQLGATNNAIREIYMVDRRNDNGTHTGTIKFQTNTYTGGLRITVYDKTKELLENNGLKVPTMTRYELQLHRKNPTVQDIFTPYNIFWKFCPKALISNPVNVDWKSSPKHQYSQISQDMTAEAFVDMHINKNIHLKALISHIKSFNDGEEIAINALIHLFKESKRA